MDDKLIQFNKAPMPEKQIIITLTTEGELKIDTIGLPNPIEVIGLLEMVKAGQITNTMIRK